MPQRTAPVENVILQILAEEAVGKLMIMRLWAEEGALGGTESRRAAWGSGGGRGAGRHEGRRRGD